jgi:sulfite reductase beta subunit-like hemoprotein
MTARSEGRILWGAFAPGPAEGSEEAYIESYAGEDVEHNSAYGVIHDEHGHWHVILAPDRTRAEETIYQTCTEAQAAAEKMFRVDIEGTP